MPIRSSRQPGGRDAGRAGEVIGLCEINVRRETDQTARGGLAQSRLFLRRSDIGVIPGSRRSVLTDIVDLGTQRDEPIDELPAPLGEQLQVGGIVSMLRRQNLRAGQQLTVERERRE